MGYGERNAWVGLVLGVASTAVYAVLIVTQYDGRGVAEIDWLGPMLWTIGLSIVVTILVTIGWGIVAGARHPGEGYFEDVRDKDIARLGSRVGQAFLVLGMVGALVLCAVEAEWFWIANTLYAGFAASALLDCVTRVVVYRHGMP